MPSADRYARMTPEQREGARESDRRYSATEKRSAAHRRHNATENRRVAFDRYNATLKGAGRRTRSNVKRREARLAQNQTD